MSTKTLLATGLCVAAALVLGFASYVAAYEYVPSLRQDAALAECDAVEQRDLIDCIFRGIKSEIKRDGLQGGMDIFSKAYERFPLFGTTGCHLHAHRIGDIAYYDFYLGVGDFDAMDFPQSTTACGYAFFHGFFEHWTQDHPAADAIVETCAYFIGRLGEDMKDIGPMCFHGAGHGLMLAAAENNPEYGTGSLDEAIHWAADICLTLPEISAAEKEQCFSGIFTILKLWINEGEYGLARKPEDHFFLCRDVRSELEKACYYEMAQDLGRPGVTLAEIFSASRSAPAAYADLTFRVGVSGTLQSEQLTANAGYAQALRQCKEIEPAHIPLCIRSIIIGLFEHGKPQQEYSLALAMCRDIQSTEEQLAAGCFETTIHRLARFYTPTRIAGICQEFPEEYRTACLSSVPN